MKYAVVTGSTKGIGKAIAIKLLGEGYFVFFNYASDDSARNDLEKEILLFKGRYITIKKELSSYDDVIDFVKDIYSVTTKIDCLILNSAITDRSSFIEITKEAWEKVINTNLNVPFYLIQQLASSIRNDVGRIIFIGSVLGQQPHAASLGYSITKAAIHQMSRDLVKVFADRKITVNTILPGFTNTSWQEDKPTEIRKSIESKIALGRFGEPEEIAGLCIEVIRNQYINGALLNIDGGYSYK